MKIEWLFIWTKLNPLHPKDAKCQIWLKLAEWFCRRTFFKISLMYFSYFVITSPWKRIGPFIWTNLNTLPPKMHCVKFYWNWQSGMEISSIYFSYWKRAGLFILLNLSPPYPRMLCAKFGWNWPNGSGVEGENVKSLR